MRVLEPRLASSMICSSNEVQGHATVFWEKAWTIVRSSVNLKLPYLFFSFG